MAGEAGHQDWQMSQEKSNNWKSIGKTTAGHTALQKTAPRSQGQPYPVGLESSHTEIDTCSVTSSCRNQHGDRAAT